MDPIELLGILPTCHLGKFCSKKYLAIVLPKMESLFGNLEQHQQPIWLLHLLAFSLDPPPSQFEVSRGAEFRPRYMESVVKFSGGRIPIVGFPVSPGFKLEILRDC
ncbi:hypothetical protein NC651_002526 [Populus alba x Populus x berolinensis]|nr:hypothetical protein NC651_002526 [Populus alba x Populus x berolinensis]